MATACGNRLMSVSQHSLLSITPGTLRKSPRCIFTSSALGSFKGASQPSPALGIILKGRDFKGTLYPTSSLDGTQVINFAETTTSPSFTSLDFRPWQTPTRNTALGFKTLTAADTETAEPPTVIEPLWHFITAVRSFI